MFTGFRRDDQFVVKTYKHTQTHSVYNIELENDGRDMILTHERTEVEE